MAFAQTNPLVIEDEFSDCYTYCYIISDVGTSKVYDQPASDNVYVADFHGQNNQQWIIMPTYPKSNEAFIISRRNGFIMDRSLLTDNLYCYAGHFNGGSNQKWRIGPSGTGYSVYSYGTTKVWDRPGSGDIYCAFYHGGVNQTITFNRSISLGNEYSTEVINYNIYASMPPELNGLNEQFQYGKHEGDVLQSVTVIPFTLINDPGWSLDAQMNYSPYYRLEKYQYWKLIDYKQFQSGDVMEYSSTTSSGCVTQNSQIIKAIMNVSYEYNAKLTVPIDGISAAVGQNIKTNLGVEYTYTNQETYSYKNDESFTLTRTSSQDQLFFFYVLIDEFRLYRMNENGENYLLRWEYADPDLEPFYQSYPNVISTSPGGCYSENNYQPYNSIPIMFSDISSQGIASASSEYSSTYAAWKAFDGEDESGDWSRWISASNGMYIPQWISYDFQTTSNVQSYAIQIESGLPNRSPSSWKLQGYTGSSWLTVDSRSNYTISKWQEKALHYFTVPVTASFSKFRLLIEAVNGSSVASIVKFKLFAPNVVPSKSARINLTQIDDTNKQTKNDLDVLTVFPNPTSGEVSIKIDPKSDLMELKYRVDSISIHNDSMDRKFQIGVYNIYGQLEREIYQGFGTVHYNFNLRRGIYLVKVHFDDKIMTERLIVK